MSKAPYPVGLDIADEPAAWASAGFRIEAGNLVRLGEITIRLCGGEGGIVQWTFRNLQKDVESIDGIPVAHDQSEPVQDHVTAPHPNGCFAVDHIVLISPDWQRSIQNLGAVGLEPSRQTNSVRKGVTQVIYRPSSVIIELVGPKIAPEKPMLWGLTLVTADVDKAHALLQSSTKAPWPAVQPGRRMTVLQGHKHGVTVGVALMSPHVKGLEGTDAEREKLFEDRARAQEKELSERADQERSKL